MATADIGLIGLAVMGQNLVLNMNDHGFTVAVFNRTVSKVDDFLANEAKETKVIGTRSLEEFVIKLKKPRVAMLLVKAGDAVESFINKLVPLLEPGDIIIDGGNSEYLDTNRRCNQLMEKGILYVGSGVSGGEEGARHGPSLMPGGNLEAWPRIRPIFEAISAKAKTGEPCCGWTGPGGSGHFVKMVHNGIEYGDMQLIAEAYHLLRDVAKLTNEEMAEVFREWNRGPLESYLVEITAAILSFKDKDGSYLLDHILDGAGQKGTGKWTAIFGLEHGAPITLIAEAVFSRILSSMRALRLEASGRLPGPKLPCEQTFTKEEKKRFVEQVRQALYASKVMSYTQGFMLLGRAHEDFGWKLDMGAIALMWRGGCIIQSKFLGNIKEAFDKNPDLHNLLLDPFFRDTVAACQNGWREIVALAALKGIPCPAFGSALSHYDGLRCIHLPANLLQAQRDYFGAHQFERLEKPGAFEHANWTGQGGSVASSTYQL
ncbi:6-phosphogluconate dehydrogenase decarboxylating [Fasciola hepatica]|uniref:6-phosphogluconate dehydrogenase, decarboxylating n=1 Tax=Fasciola hepatica TaxID=6192 RepID=A0A4E0R825_FASHE|nr:6-phosphogluconate dehydrogenase decarboxylating [Fasciola hepatica]